MGSSKDSSAPTCMPIEPDLLERTLMAAKKDVATVSQSGEPLGCLTEGVKTKPIPTHIDERGTVAELFDPRWDWHPDPFAFAYMFTVRPGTVKGWGLHKHHEDRYVLLQGEMALVLFDPRPESSTYGQVCKIMLSENDRRLVSIPKFVWHADHNFGSEHAVVINFPTSPYDHSDPDKYRLPITTPLIPYSFGDARGG
jgi:dTDP-4-dehydrorhamnose 3,5-epimerase